MNYECGCQQEYCASLMCQNAGHHGEWHRSITALNRDRDMAEKRIEVTQKYCEMGQGYSKA